MKKTIILLLISGSLQAQNYADSTITLQLTQRMAWWVAKGISINADNRKEPDPLKNFVGSGTRPDSVYNVTLKARLLRDGLELLLTRPLLLSINDYNSIILNSPAISGYTSLKSQIVTRAAGSTNQKQVATWLRDWYLSRENDMLNLYNEEKAKVLKLVQ
jgi:hypothetical protein